MRRGKYLPYILVPLVLGLFLAFEWAYALARGPRATVAYSFSGTEREAGLLDRAAKSGDVARLRERPLAAAFDSPGFVVWDQAMTPTNPPPPAGGPPYRDLEQLKDLAWKGSSVLLGFRTFADTPSSDALRDLAETAGLRPAAWAGAYIIGLERKGNVPESFRRAWEGQSGQAWGFRGDGIILRNLADGRALVLLRGKELGGGGLRVLGGAGGADGRYAGPFLVMEALADTKVEASLVPDLLGPGKELFRANGLPDSFPALSVQAYGQGRVWTMAGDFAGSVVTGESAGPLPLPGLERRRTLDSPANGIAGFQRILVPLLSTALASAPIEAQPSGTGAAGQAAAPPAAPAASSISIRAGRRYLERKDPSGEWRPWFVQGVDLGSSTPGHWATEPATDDGSWLEAFKGIAATGFDSLRVYTLMPPAFYRALSRFNLGRTEPLLLFQEIWLDEDAPGHDLLDPAWLSAALAEAELCVDALHGRAGIAPRPGKSWGDYRVDASPWLAAFLIGRELLPEEVLITTAAHRDLSFQGGHFRVARGHPVEAFLATFADRVQSREAGLYGASRPIGFVSWPTLDVMAHPGLREEGMTAAPYHDSTSVDFRAITARPEEKSGFFTAFNIYPNYPDFMIHESRYDRPDPSGMERYGAYLDDLLASLPPVPLLIGEFGLSTGFGTAHIHPEGLDHGGLREGAQAAGLAALFRTIARHGTAGGMVFEWSDEWAKKTWTTEYYMIPYQRHALWHNVIDPEQNYGIMAWEDSGALAWRDSGSGFRMARDSAFLYVELDPADAPGRVVPQGSAVETIEVGLDTVPGEAGQYRLSPGGPLSPQGSEFRISLRLRGGKVTAAALYVAADYDRASGLLLPKASRQGGFTELAMKVNLETTTAEGRSFPALREDGSDLPLDGADAPGLVANLPDGRILLRLPWSRLNFSDPSSMAILLDGRPDCREVAVYNGLGTMRIGEIGLWAVLTSVPSGDGEAPRLSFLPSQERNWSARLEGWERVEVSQRPKAAVAELAGLLHAWSPLDLAPNRGR